MTGFLRILNDPPARGEWNMAVDGALLDQADTLQQATLRFYRWQPPTLSLGYFQRESDRRQHAPSESLPWVRRASGGGAIVHDQELTYSLCLPHQGKAARPLYDLAHHTLLETLAELGVTAAEFPEASVDTDEDAAREQPPAPFLCFLRRARGDLICAGHKVVGSAQRRLRTAVLQHGSILLGRSPSAPELPGLGDLAPEADLDRLADRWTRRLTDRLGLAGHPGELTAGEQQVADRLMQEFSHPGWKSRR